MFLSWRTTRPMKDRDDPAGPDEALGFTEGGKTMVAVAIAFVVLVLLFWIASGLARA